MEVLHGDLAISHSPWHHVVFLSTHIQGTCPAHMGQMDIKGEHSVLAGFSTYGCDFLDLVDK
jgi:hypothetical protein